MSNFENNEIKNNISAESEQENFTQETSTDGEKDIEQVESDAAKNSKTAFSLKLSKPLELRNGSVSILNFNFENLTGDDFIKIETEIADTLGRMIISPEYSSDFLIRTAARACEQKVGIEDLKAISIKDFNILRRKCRSFFLSAV